MLPCKLLRAISKFFRAVGAFVRSRDGGRNLSRGNMICPNLHVINNSHRSRRDFVQFEEQIFPLLSLLPTRIRVQL